MKEGLIGNSVELPFETVGDPDVSVESLRETGKRGTRKTDRCRDRTRTANIGDLLDVVVNRVGHPHASIGTSSEESRRGTDGHCRIQSPSSARVRNRSDIVCRLVNEPHRSIGCGRDLTRRSANAHSLGEREQISRVPEDVATGRRDPKRPIRGRSH